MSVGFASDARLDIGKVIADAFGVLGRNILPFGLAAILMIGLPNLVSGLGQLMGKTDPVFSILTVVGGIIGLVGTIA